MRRFLAALALAAWGPALAADPPRSPFWGQLERGGFGVGVTVIDERDTSRKAFAPDDGKGRPIRIVTWHPAASGSGERLTLRRYVQMGSQGVDAFSKEPLSLGKPPVLWNATLDTPLFAELGARPMHGRFPLVVFLHASPWSASVMSEYLASNGFVVAAFESQGAVDREYRLSRDNLDAMMQDLAFVVARMRREANVSDRFGVIGMSNGALAGTAIQLLGLMPRAIVSLDGTVGEKMGSAWLAERSGGNSRKFIVPMLHLYTPANPHLELDPLRGYAAKPVLIDMGGIRHVDFLAYAALENVIAGAFGAVERDPRPSFEAICRYTEAFLRWHLGGDASGRMVIERAPGKAP